MTATVLQFPIQKPVRANAVESLKLLKSTLRKAFPSVKFSTRLSRGTGYGYAGVSWTDGPSTSLVDAMVGPFEGSHFDGMIDMEEYRESVMPDGRATGLRGVSTSRHISAAFARRLLAQIATYYRDARGVPAIEEYLGYDGSKCWKMVNQNISIGGEWYTTHMHRAAQDATRYTHDAR